MSYPEHEKLQAIRDKSEAIGDFIEWLRNIKKFTLAKWYKMTDDEDGEDRLMPEFPSIEKLLAEYFNIDLNKLAAEKMAMLEECRKANSQ